MTEFGLVAVSPQFFIRMYVFGRGGGARRVFTPSKSPISAVPLAGWNAARVLIASRAEHGRRPKPYRTPQSFPCAAISSPSSVVGRFCGHKTPAWPTQGALHPAPLVEAPLQRHRAMSAVAASKRRNQNFLVPWRAARAHAAPCRTSRPPTEHVLRTADLAWLSSRPTRGALHPTPLAEAPLHRH